MNIFNIIKDNYEFIGFIIGTIGSLYLFFKWIYNCFNKRKYNLVDEYIKTNSNTFFEFKNLSENLNISECDLRDILRKLDLEGKIKDSPVDTVPKYTFFHKL